jgi:hypothetical protein
MKEICKILDSSADVTGTDYPAALWLPADPTNYHAAARATFSRIVIHRTDGQPRAQLTAKMWTEPHHGDLPGFFGPKRPLERWPPAPWLIFRSSS